MPLIKSLSYYHTSLADPPTFPHFRLYRPNHTFYPRSDTGSGIRGI
jgi:hypothetical protein